MPARISSSSSTLMVFRVLGSTPQAFKIWMARPEKPHWGKLALPFMNSTTSLDFTSSSMRFWVSLMSIILVFRWRNYFTFVRAASTVTLHGEGLVVLAMLKIAAYAYSTGARGQFYVKNAVDQPPAPTSRAASPWAKIAA